MVNCDTEFRFIWDIFSPRNILKHGYSILY